MKPTIDLLVCGTAAAEGVPALFCSCGICAEARKRGGKNIRSRTSYMIGEAVRIDFGPDAFMHMALYSLAYEKLSHLLMTHTHQDHWFPDEFFYRRKWFSTISGPPLQVFGNSNIDAYFKKADIGDWSDNHSVFKTVTPFTPIELPGGLKATGIPADHDRREECLFYLIESPTHRLLIAHDTGWLPEKSWNFLTDRPLDAVFLDASHGVVDQLTNHMGGTILMKFRDELQKRKSLAPGARVFATHFSHNGHGLHEDFEAFYNPHGIQVAYDGLRLSL